jgi:hypothetical protein
MIGHRPAAAPSSVIFLQLFTRFARTDSIYDGAVLVWRPVRNHRGGSLELIRKEAMLMKVRVLDGCHSGHAPGVVGKKLWQITDVLFRISSMTVYD